VKNLGSLAVLQAMVSYGSIKQWTVDDLWNKETQEKSPARTQFSSGAV